MSDHATLGQRVKQLRTRLDLRQADVAEHLAIPRSAVAMLEGDHRHLTFGEAVALAELLGVSLDLLAGRNTVQIDAYADAYRQGWKAGRASIADPMRALLLATDGMSEDRTRRAELPSEREGDRHAR